MQSSDNMLSNASSSLQHISRQALERFSEPLDCLTGHLMLECPEVLAAELCLRINNNDDFPHEIGLFIGCPAKDVAAFMGMVNLPFACQGPWKIYGNPVRSLALAEQYRCCRQRMGDILATGNRGLLDLDNSNYPFFCTSVESDYQYHINNGLHA